MSEIVNRLRIRSSWGTDGPVSFGIGVPVGRVRVLELLTRVLVQPHQLGGLILCRVMNTHVILDVDFLQRVA
jgi:hypothetical protein